ncbi:4-alpha-glucanotransferase [Streptomyces sp. NPDC097619]|uniref:4-alpha-glucanotransferase n=1 Tax=Streptomyces sp. NPDC097619 TaxID=3157228 RepID=UPI003327DC6B
MSLDRLAALHGVATSYAPARDVTVAVPERTVLAVLGSLGVDASTPEALAAALAAAEAPRPLPPTLVHWEGGPPPAALAALPPGTRLEVALEDGGGVPWGPGLPLGVHRLTARLPDGGESVATLVVAPDRAPAPPARSHGFLVQLYSLLTDRSWGMGDLGDLAELADWAARAHGAGFVQVNPLHAAVPGSPTDPSPYRPSSRRFPDPVHLRVPDLPEYDRVTEPERRAALDRLAERGAALRRAVLEEGALIDRDAVWKLKRAALRLLHAEPRTPEREAAYREFRARQGPALDAHAAWCAAASTAQDPRGARGPREAQDPQDPQEAQGPQTSPDPAETEFHRWLVWLTETQLAAAQRAARTAGMDIGLVHDLAVGVHPEGSDVRSRPGSFATVMSVGAPPDAFNAQGQDWGLPPWRPDALAASGYAPYRELLRGLLGHAGALRIDHVMGLFRLWWIPAGRPPTEGTYVSYDAEAMLAILVLEAHRAGAAVIGEDLGTVAPGVREALARRGVLGTSVLWFERDWDGGGRPLDPADWRADCLATVTTHDLPPTAARLSGEHLELRDRLGLLARPLAEERAADSADTAEWLTTLSGLGFDTADEEAAVRALYGFLRRTPARLVGVWLPDTVGDRRPQNLPGTWDQYPNWRLPVADAAGRPLTLAALAASGRLDALMAAVRGEG